MQNILQAGVAKSGNYWVWKIIDLSLKSTGINPSKFIIKTDTYNELKNEEFTHEDQLDTDVLDVENKEYFWRVGPYHKQKIINVEEYFAHAQHVWTHSEYSRGFEKIFNYSDKLIYIVRHPLSVAKSQANFAFTPYIMNGVPHKEKTPTEYFDNRMEWAVRSWSQNVSGWLANIPDNSYVLFYENFHNNFDVEYERLLNYLGLELSKDQVETVKKSVTKQRMSKNNANHVNTKKLQFNVTRAQEELVKKIAGPLLDKLCYCQNTNSFLWTRGVAPKWRDEFSEISKKQRFSTFELLKAVFALLLSNRTMKNKIHIAKRKARSIINSHKHEND